MKKRILALALALCMMVSMSIIALAAEEDTATPEAVPAVDVTATEEVAEGGVITLTEGGEIETSYTIEEPATIEIVGDVTMTSTGDAFTINANTELVFEEGASLTLTGYDNAFVVENATLSGGGWVINDGDGMDLFRLKTSGQLNITSDVVLNGNGATDTTSRAIVLPGSGAQNQAIHLAANTTLEANDFYRGVETGGASNYTISGENRDTSVFDLSENDCGMFISYFDNNAHFTKCKLEVSNCTTSGIFMRQDNAALDGLYIDEVYINCVNDIDLDQADIAIRFHSNNFEITDSVINIENAWNTGLWICDGWNANEQNEITGTTINVKHVENNDDLVSSLFGSINRRKAMTFVPYRDWLISDCQITIDGTSPASVGLDDEENEMEGGINVASDIALNRNSSFNIDDWTATPGMHGGKVIFEDTTITTSGVLGADVGAQVGQWIEIGKNVVIENGENDRHYTVVCDDVNNGYPVQYLFGVDTVNYVTTGMSETNKDPDRLIVTGGSYRSTRDDDIEHNGVPVPYYCSVPINEAGEDLTMFEVSSDAFGVYAQNGAIGLIDCNGESYSYEVANASARDIRYIWAPAVTVTFEGDQSYTVPRGTPWGLTHETLPDGSWTYNGEAFTADTVITGDITVTAQ